jgi:hypothetical protein
VYIDALCGRAIYVHAGAAGGISRIGFEPDWKFKEAAKFWFARPGHAELVYLRCVQDFASVGAMRPRGWVDMPPAGVVETIKATAAMLGAKWQTEAEIQRDAETVVAGIVQRVKDARMDGELKQVNAEYRMYRLGQLEKGELAIPYSAHIAEFTRLLVVRAAEKSMMQSG